MEQNRIKLICSLEKKISDFIFRDNGSSCHFDYNISAGKKINLTVYTVNPKQDNELFIMFKTFVFDSKEECLNQVLEYLHSIKNQKKDENFKNCLLTYEVVWGKVGNTKKYTSWVNGKNLMEICNKFFEGKEPKDYIIRKMELMPES